MAQSYRTASHTAARRKRRTGPRLHTLAALALFASALLAGREAQAAESVKISAFDGSFINFPLYVAADLHLFEKHGVNAELIYGTGIQTTNMVVSGATEFGGFAVEHGVQVIGKGQKLKLLVLNETNPPFDLIVRKDLPLPNLAKGYPHSIADLKGLKLGVSTPGASADTSLRLLLKQAGLDPDRDVHLVPIGDPTTQLAALRNHTVDGAMAFEPIQTQAVLGEKTAKSVVNLEKGDAGPDIYRSYAFNGVFARQDYIDKHPAVVKSVVDAVVEAEQLINDPAHIDEVVKVAANRMHGIAPDLLKQYIETYRGIFVPTATPAAIANVNRFLQFQQQITTPVPYEQVVATAYMPKTFTPIAGK
ncbi:ABC transporter substrate-binding protein [Paraburkholderia dipogonis]|uniref:ABC transporter substrate-binding protein n=1 Tax=Paraburkholderia dipogonis TaxID=1211383 RepID=A0ABW9B3D8_9BURK